MVTGEESMSKKTPKPANGTKIGVSKTKQTKVSGTKVSFASVPPNKPSKKPKKRAESATAIAAANNINESSERPGIASLGRYAPKLCKRPGTATSEPYRPNLCTRPGRAISPYHPKHHPNGIETFGDLAISRHQPKGRWMAGLDTPVNFGVEHTPTRTWKLWANRPSEEWIATQKKNKFGFPDGFGNVGLSLENQFHGSPVVMETGELAFRVEHWPSRSSKIILVKEVYKPGRFYMQDPHFPIGFERAGEEVLPRKIWRRSVFQAGGYRGIKPTVDIMEGGYRYRHLPVIEGP